MGSLIYQMEHRGKPLSIVSRDGRLKFQIGDDTLDQIVHDAWHGVFHSAQQMLDRISTYSEQRTPCHAVERTHKSILRDRVERWREARQMKFGPFVESRMTLNVLLI